MNRQTTSRIAAATAAFAMTAVLMGSQLGLADHYTAQADALLAAQRASAPVALNYRPNVSQKRA